MSFQLTFTCIFIHLHLNRIEFLQRKCSLAVSQRVLRCKMTAILSRYRINAVFYNFTISQFALILSFRIHLTDTFRNKSNILIYTLIIFFPLSLLEIWNFSNLLPCPILTSQTFKNSKITNVYVYKEMSIFKCRLLI